ncbi:MAG: sugar transferase [Caldilineaceae bacterium]|nr:sugar transferase [Caldilineaceae bacterium]
MKRVLDLALCLLVLPTLLPIIAICGLLIWLDDPGPIFFKQLRTGKGGRRFRMYKLRTMATNAEELKLKYAHLNELTWPDFKITNDPRVTRIGRILRKTSLDELPQIFNIIKGDMSWVGPRPTSFDVSTYSLWHTERLEVIPGLTGLWQVSGRSDLDFDDRLRLDIAYIERKSILLDIQILFQTVTAIFTQRGAY